MQSTPRRALEGFILQKKLSPRKLRNLLQVADAAERLSSRPYLQQADIERIVERFGVKPDVSSWGDFFAAEVATDHWEKPESEFEKICETIIFDFIAAALIFVDKEPAFLETILIGYNESIGKAAALRNAEDEERIHLGILAGYFRQMGIQKDLLSQDDLRFFDFYSTRAQSA